MSDDAAECRRLAKELKIYADRLEAKREIEAERDRLVEERNAATDAVGLPRSASLDDLIRHHRNNAAMAVALASLTKPAHTERCSIHNCMPPWKCDCGASLTKPDGEA